jgi:2-phosphoglycerate kinase
VTEQSNALFIGGRAGVGKSSVGYEIHPSYQPPAPSTA